MAKKKPVDFLNDDPKKPIHGYNDRGKPICAAKKKQGEGICNRPAGWGTDHAGWGRCKLHGGVSQGKKRPDMEGNKYAFKHGGRSRKPLYFDKLSAHEQEKYESITTDVLEQLDINIRLCEIKIDRFMALLEKVREFELGIVSETEETEEGATTTKDGLPIPISKIKKIVQKESGMNTSISIQNQIDKTQNTLTKLLDLKHKLQSTENPEKIIAEYVSLQKMARVARARREEENGEERENNTN